MKRLASTLSPILLALTLLACERSDSPPDARATEAELPARVVSLAPSVTETVFALGAGDRLVGVTRFCDYPLAATTLPQVGGLTDVDVEMVLSLRPDLVIGVQSKTGGGLERTLSKAGIPALFVPVETFEDIQSSMREIGRQLGAASRAEALAADIGRVDLPVAPDSPRVLLLFGREPWIAAGPRTFGDELIRRAGGRNAVAHLEAPYPTLDAELLGSLDVDLVVDTSWGGGGEPAPIPTAGAARVVRLDPALIRPGPRLALAMDQLRDAIAGAGKP